MRPAYNITDALLERSVLYTVQYTTVSTEKVNWTQHKMLL